MDLLVAGLGNPGRRYGTTRHNLGFLVCELLARRHAAGATREKHGCLLQEVRLESGVTLALVRPLSFMNLSGGPVAKAARAYGVEVGRIIAVHDDVESAFGRVRAKLGGGLAGHNGLRSLTERLGTRDYPRVRLGIGRQRAGDRRDLADWVLSPFEPDEEPLPMIEAAADCVELIASDGIAAALERYP